MISGEWRGKKQLLVGRGETAGLDPRNRKRVRGRDGERACWDAGILGIS
jgi:hypothetical protein